MVSFEQVKELLVRGRLLIAYKLIYIVIRVFRVQVGACYHCDTLKFFSGPHVCNECGCGVKVYDLSSRKTS